eukprot:2979795-Pyramimonas_sp.AAC.1
MDEVAERNRLAEEVKLLKTELALSEKLRLALHCGAHGPTETLNNSRSRAGSFPGGLLSRCRRSG